MGAVRCRRRYASGARRGLIVSASAGVGASTKIVFILWPKVANSFRRTGVNTHSATNPYGKRRRNVSLRSLLAQPNASCPCQITNYGFARILITVAQRCNNQEDFGVGVGEAYYGRDRGFAERKCRKTFAACRAKRSPHAGPLPKGEEEKRAGLSSLRSVNNQRFDVVVA